MTVGAGGTFDLNGRSDTVGALVMNGGAVTTGAGTLVLAGNITSNATAATATISGNLVLGGPTCTVTVAPGTAVEQLIIAANVNGNGLTKAGAGALVLSGDNNYTGPTTVSAGVLDVRSSTALGSTVGDTTVAPKATLEIEGTGLTLGDALTLGKGKAGAALVNLGGDNVWTGNINLAGTNIVNVTGGRLRLAGVLSGTGGLTKTGAGTLLLTGTGKIGPLTLNAASYLSPGAGVPGTLTATNVTFAPGSYFDVDINGTTAGTGYDQLISTGSVALGSATLNVSLGSFAPTTGRRFTIITRTSADAKNTTFAGLAEGATFMVGTTAFQITYVGGTSGHDVVLIVQ